MPATLRDLFYCRYDPMEAAEPNRPEYNAIYEELEQVEGELRKALGEEGRENNDSLNSVALMLEQVLSFTSSLSCVSDFIIDWKGSDRTL